MIVHVFSHSYQAAKEIMRMLYHLEHDNGHSRIKIWNYAIAFLDSTFFPRPSVDVSNVVVFLQDFRSLPMSQEVYLTLRMSWKEYLRKSGNPYSPHDHN